MDRIFGLTVVVYAYIIYCAIIIKALNRPSFESSWRVISIESTIDIPHNLGVYPAKVDVQIRVTKEGVDYIFTGTGAAQRDDDIGLSYGGIVYIYDTEIVRLITPDGRDSNDGQSSDVGIAYTGARQYYNGGSTILATSGHVRVRLWTANNFPEPNFSKTFSMDTTVRYKTFNEVSHGLGKYPGMVSVRIQLDDGFMSDGQGVVFQSSPESSWQSLSGVLYGYDDANVRVWVPYKHSDDSDGLGTVCCCYDGWNTRLVRTNGTVDIRAWLLDQTFHDFTVDTREVNITSGASPILFPVMDFSDFYINVEVLTSYGDNSKYIFGGAGSAMLGTVDDDYGGLIYVYTNNSVMVWIPNANNDGHVQYVGKRWGDRAQDSRCDVGQLIVKVYTFRDLIKCEDPDTVANAFFTMNGSKVTYTCYPGYAYATGNLTLTCQSNGTWNGYPPVCTEKDQSRTIDIPHNLGVYPAKVDVQIRVTKEGVDYIFTGSGAAQRDNDLEILYGGVVYIYDTEIKTQSYFMIYKFQCCVLTHQNVLYIFWSHPYYNGGPTILATSGQVRVRLWTANDFPEPIFSTTFSMDTTDKDKIFKEVSHGLGKYPDMVSVRIQLDNGFMSDGQGVVFHALPVYSNSLSGVLYGYNNENVRVWIPHRLLGDYPGFGFVCCCIDGWSKTIVKSNGTVHIHAWLLDHNFHDFTVATQEVNSVSGASPILFPVMDFSDFYINVEVNTGYGDNSAYIFGAAGSAMLGTEGGDYGGLIYIYTNNSVMVWIPNAYYGGHVQFVGGRWGNKIQDSKCDDGQLIVKVYTFRDFIECEDPVTVANAFFTLNGSKVTYTCHLGYTHETGNLTRACQSNGTWNGFPPVCTVECEDPVTVANAFFTMNGSKVTYDCHPGYTHETGDLTRTCQSNGTWNGFPPVCTGTCGLPLTYNYTTQTYTGVTSGSIAQFKCNFGYAFASGSIQHQCFPPNWIGNPIVCKDVLSTEEVTEMINKIEKELTVDKKTTSTFHRRKHCAEDPRPSSKQIGLIGMFIMTVCFSLILILDCIGGGRKE
ncbi:Hypothetical predicted protein [Mytilus galloprovincialis]|uniref:Sushi domain-containing protein n=1 Tax=Mytilus galloprovincialis TaxID=29158 RepID=A0A8B6FVL3_MYTGA|nr:Hypothetical predicted protein [Mytilus galloprovincialis]